MEPPAVLPSDDNLKQWPSKGQVELRDVEMRYRPELPLVVKVRSCYGLDDDLRRSVIVCCRPIQALCSVHTAYPVVSTRHSLPASPSL